VVAIHEILNIREMIRAADMSRCLKEFTLGKVRNDMPFKDLNSDLWSYCDSVMLHLHHMRCVVSS